MPYHHGNLRTALIEEGIKIVNEDGVGGCSLRRAAAACGVSRGAPYAHFKDKEEMLEAMKQYVAEKFAAILNKAVDDCTDSGKLLIEIGKAYLHFFIDNPNYCPFLFNQTNLQIVLMDNDEKVGDYRQFENDKNAFVVIMDELDVPEPLQMQNMIALWAMVHGLSGIVTMKGVEFDGEWDDMIEKVLSENLVLVTKVDG